MHDQNLVAVKEPKHSSAESGGRSRRSKVAEGNLAVGFKKEVEQLTRELHDSGKDGQLKIILIHGYGGVGKTTLAREVYDQCLTLEMFEIRVWVVVPQDYCTASTARKKDLLVRILKSAFPEKHEDYRNNSEGELADELLKCLKDKKYLIVMDDIWSIKPWEDIQNSFPEGHNGSKVMFTSRLPIAHDSINYHQYQLKPLTDSCSWELLEKKVFGKEHSCPPELVKIGEQIARQCKGYPLSIIAVAGILATKDSLEVWQDKSKRISNLRTAKAESEDICIPVLELSYDDLPPHLKECLLYIGAHAEEYQINVRELICLWIAEGFIQQSETGESLETVAKGYLNDLIRRNLIMVAGKNKFSREIRKCYMHDLVHEVCFNKAREKKFLLKLFWDYPYPYEDISKYSRLFVAHHFRDKLLLQSLGSLPKNLRSFTCFAFPIAYHEMSFFSKCVELKVLNIIVAESQEGTGLRDPSLTDLRYLGLRCLKVESFFHSLPMLETIILHDNNAEYSLPSDIFKMDKLRHLYSNRKPFNFHGVTYEETMRNKLARLHTLEPMCSCPQCLPFLKMTPNLQKLVLSYGGLDLSDDLILLDLERLKELTVKVQRQKDQIQRVPTTRLSLKLPLTLTWLTLINTNLKWEEVSTILQNMSSLETLQLLIGACEGPVWDTSELKETFSRLKYLELSSLEIEKWNIASEDQFPILEVLVIECCANLRGIPIEFADRHELREIKVKMSSQYVMKSARKIWIKQRNMRGDDNCLNLIFYNGYGYASNVDGDDGEHHDDDDDYDDDDDDYDDDDERTTMMTDISYKMQCKQMLMMIEDRRRPQ